MKNVAKVAGATSSEGFLVCYGFVRKTLSRRRLSLFGRRYAFAIATYRSNVSYSERR